MGETLKVVGEDVPWWMRVEEQVWLKPGYWQEHLTPLIEQVEKHEGKQPDFYRNLFHFVGMTGLERFSHLYTFIHVLGVASQKLTGEIDDETAEMRLQNHKLPFYTEADREEVSGICHSFYNQIIGDEFGLSDEEKMHFLLTELKHLAPIVDAYIEFTGLFMGYTDERDEELKHSSLNFISDPILRKVDGGEQALLAWLDLITSPGYWRPNSDAASFLFVDSQKYPSQIPRYYQLGNGGKEYVFGFGGRLGIFDSQNVPFSKIQQIWDWMFKRGIYGTSMSDKEKRNYILGKMAGLLPYKGLWVDAAGAEGDLAIMARHTGRQDEVLIIDGSTIALSEAKCRGFMGLLQDLRGDIALKNECVPAVAVGFAAHLLGLNIYSEVFRILTPRGRFWINWYPKDESHLQETIRELKEVGFRVKLRPFQFVREKTSEHGPAGEMTTEVIIEATKP